VGFGPGFLRAGLAIAIVVSHLRNVGMQADNDNQAEFGKAKVAAKLAGVGYSTFRLHVKKGILPAGRRLGGAVLYDLSAIRRAIRDKATAHDIQTDANIDPIMARIAAYGPQTRTRRKASTARP
jgi:hypothetical protein